MKKLTDVAVMAVTAAVLCSAFALADVTASDVLNNLHATNQAEIHMGAVAREKGSTDEVRDYGKTLIRDHEDNDRKVIALAAKDGITLKSTKPGPMDKMEMKHLKSLTGSDFDKAFAKKMIDGHKAKIGEMESAQASALPDDVRDLVANTLPVLHKHLDMAQKIDGQRS